MFSNVYESDVLLCKLHAEYEFVHEFIGIQSAYTTRSQYKGLFLEEVLKDEKFKPFLDKITALSSKESLYPKNVPYDEQNNLICEFESRKYCWKYIQNKYQDCDWVFLEDCDEMLCFDNPKKRDILLEGFKKHNKGIQWQNYKYWWDYNNLNLNPDKYIPCHTVGHLKELEKPFYNRNYFCTRMEPNLVCGVEFSHCFHRSGNWEKVSTAAHDNYQEKTMENAYLYNTWHCEELRGEKLRYPLDFFETIDLDENNSTKFVLDNLETLKVNTIDPNYAENRKIAFNCHPHPIMAHNLLRGNKIRDDRNYYKRNN